MADSTPTVEIISNLRSLAAELEDLVQLDVPVSGIVDKCHEISYRILMGLRKEENRAAEAAGKPAVGGTDAKALKESIAALKGKALVGGGASANALPAATVNQDTTAAQAAPEVGNAVAKKRKSKKKGGRQSKGWSCAKCGRKLGGQLAKYMHERACKNSCSRDVALARKCPRCHATFRSAQGVKLHCLITPCVEGLPEHFCGKCNKRFVDEAFRNKHEASCSGRAKCRDCGWTFYDRSTLKFHQSLNSGTCRKRKAAKGAAGKSPSAPGRKRPRKGPPPPQSQSHAAESKRDEEEKEGGDGANESLAAEYKRNEEVEDIVIRLSEEEEDGNDGDGNTVYPTAESKRDQKEEVEEIYLSGSEADGSLPSLPPMTDDEDEEDTGREDDDNHSWDQDYDYTYDEVYEKENPLD